MRLTSQARGLPAALARTNSLAELTACEFLALLRQREISVEDYARACADRIERFNPTLRAFKSYDSQRLTARARAIDERLADGAPVTHFCGVPIAVKDIFNTYDFPTGMGSRIIDGYTPGNDARVVSDLRLAGAIVAGKTITAEFAVHHPGETLNPYDFDRTPGTSSSGSAVAVATHMTPVALATQTAGSTIRPASYCGVMGFKPSFGLIPRTAVLKTTDTLDTIAFMARSVPDLRLVFELARVRGHNYPVTETALGDPARMRTAGRPWRVGILDGPRSSLEAKTPSRGLGALVARLEADGCAVSPFRLPASFGHAHALHATIYHKALAYYFEIEYRAKKELFSDTLRLLIEDGMRISSEDYHDACRAQHALARELDAALADFDVVVGLATADEAPVGLANNGPEDHCLIWTMCGAPAITLPLLRGDHGLPVGVQISARKYSDYALLDFAEYLWNLAAI